MVGFNSDSIEAELAIQAYRVLADMERAGEPGALELDVIAVPRVLEVESHVVEVLRDFPGGSSGLLVRKMVLFCDRDRVPCGFSRATRKYSQCAADDGPTGSPSAAAPTHGDRRDDEAGGNDRRGVDPLAQQQGRRE